MKFELHDQIVNRHDALCAWMKDKARGLQLPIYLSIDVRDAGFKLAPVDANIYPAGFNNICQADKERAPEVFSDYLDSHYGKEVRKILLVAEEHTGNPYYWDNVLALASMLRGVGREVVVSIPRSFSGSSQIKSATGQIVEIVGTQRDGPRLKASNGFVADLIVSNNDFSIEYAEWGAGLETPVNPARELGWYRRRKDRFFRIYNGLAAEFSKLVGCDPWLLSVGTELFSEFDLTDDSRIQELAARVDHILAQMQNEYSRRKIDVKPVVFIKNNSGTYGMGVTSVASGAEVIEWNAKSRKKMQAAKGGREVTEVILQESIPTTVLSEKDVAEPTLYLVGCQLIGGFLRAHHEKGPQESLNSPGAVYRRLCMSDLDVSFRGSLLENVYGWVGKLSALSVGLEAKEMGIQYKGRLPAQDKPVGSC